MPKACVQCAEILTGRSQGRRFCQPACYHAWLRDRAAESLVARFWAKVNIGREDECWLWTASTIRGYGQYHAPRVDAVQPTIYAHRFSWELANGPIPDNLQVLHRCDCPLCVNPNHLFLGTQADNLADAVQKGRLVCGRHLIKVSDAAVLDIRTTYQARKNGRALAAKHGITLVSVMRIVNGTQRVRRSLDLTPVSHRDLPITGEVS